MCWINIIVAIVISIIGELIRPKAKSNSGRPAGLGDFQFPTAEAGRVIPWLAGTVKVLGPNTTASGLLRSEESYVRVRTGWFSTAKQSYGYRYYLSFQQIICGGLIDDIVGFQVNDAFLKVKTKTVTADYIDILIDDPAFYGDAKKDGGFSGLIRVYRGSPTQPVDTVLKNVLAQTEISAYRYVCYAMFRDFYLGMSENPPPIIPVVARYPNGLGITSNRHIIGGSASNVICAAYDLLTDMIRCMAVPAAKVDTAAFMAAAVTCYNEGLGYCGIKDGSQDGKATLDDLMQYADGQIFQDPFTSMWTIKLARDDYNVATLPVLDESNSRVTSKTKTSWADTKNTVVVAFIDKNKNWTNQSVQVVDSANLIVLGQTINSTTLELSGIDNPDEANFIGERSRSALSTPFTQMEIEAQGVGANLRINDVFLAKYPTTKRIAQMVMRITDVTYPNNDETTCNIQAVEDKYGVKFVAFKDTGNTGWSPPDFTPHAMTVQRLDELPWAMTPVLDGGRYATALAARADGVTTGYQIWQSAPSTDPLVKSSDDGDLAAAGTITADMGTNGGYSAGSITLSSVVDGQDILPAFQADFDSGLYLLWIGNELIAYRDVTQNIDGTVTFSTLKRGVYDTVPEKHTTGDTAFVVNTGITMVQNQPYASDMTIGVRLAGMSGSITLAPTTGALMTKTLTSRATRPYPPGRVLVNALWVANNPSITGGALTFDWRHRGRVTLGTKVVAFDDNANYGPDAGTTYELRIYNNTTNALLFTVTGLTGTSTVVPAGTFTAAATLRAQLIAVVGGISSQFPVVGLITFTP